MRNGLRISLKLLSVNNCSSIKCYHTITTTKCNNHLLVCATVRPLSTSSFKRNNQQNYTKANKTSSLTEDTRQTANSDVTTIGEKVKQTTKDASYLSIILLGGGVLCVIFYAVFRELFTSQSPSGVYSRAYKRCVSDPRVQYILGEPIKGYGEMTRRGRRRHVSNVSYEKDGVMFTRVKFYLEGPVKKATVHAEVSSNTNEFRYLFIELDDSQRSVLVLEDNRT